MMKCDPQMNADDADKKEDLRMCESRDKSPGSLASLLLLILSRF